MTDQDNSGLFAFTKAVPVTFPALFAPRRVKRNGKETGEPRFEGTFIFDPQSPDWVALKQLAAKIAKGRNPSVDLASLAYPFKNGTAQADKRQQKAGKDDAAFMRGKGLLVARSKFQPKLSVTEGGRIVDLEDDAQKTQFKSRFYSGVEVFAQINLVWYNAVQEGSKDGITAYLNVVCSTGKGKRLGGGEGQAGSALFGGYLGQLSAADPTAGSDDEIPF